MENRCLLEMSNITKEFSGVKVLDDISFNLFEGEIHAIVGENGAGKSTLMKIISGVYQPTSGDIEFMGKKYSSFTPRESLDLGISIIYQELSVINVLTISENIFLGRLPFRKWMGMRIVDYKTLNVAVEKCLSQVGLNVSGGEYVENLKISEKQLVEIAKAISVKAKIIIMDEPTSSLSKNEIKKLFFLIKRLKKQKGVSVIFISHKLKEVKEIADRITILKDGRVMATRLMDEVSIDEVINLMVGRELKVKYSNVHMHQRAFTKDKIPTLEVKNLTINNRITDISFRIYSKEIVGFFGLVGAGRTEIVRAIFGADKYIKGDIYLHGKKVNITNPYSALKRGIGLIPEDRREEGILNNFTIWQNMTLPLLQKKSTLQGFIGRTNPREEKKISRNYYNILKIKSTSLDQLIFELSGGNQQKVVVGKWLMAEADILIFDEPTKGIDVGSKDDIYKIILGLARSGKTLILISSETEELLYLCSRIYVLNDGKITAEYPIEEATEEKLIYNATIVQKIKEV